jgi:hypothetical protein
LVISLVALSRAELYRKPGHNYELGFSPGQPELGCMGMHLLGQAYKDDKQFRTNTARYIAETQKELISSQNKEGSWPDKTWKGQQEYPGDACVHFYRGPPPEFPHHCASPGHPVK